ncbi:tetratricopeptide repeat protein [Planctomicrobium piriforme]|uniref:Tetratricopeptide repeat-containing protein n=1 Tax=Planctomicrobium piriforme TaxID=1576369 RepID=A0A1I3PTG8_9PLAN|nr:tetratricopeptide repeat protein [Planctomicrobium piriforme]SFJ24710.1 Tetratricopeptide repeat-containing protein [Planctomicrobium piriforme]
MNIIGNRPGWDRPGNGWNQPGWGWGGNGGGWRGNWHNYGVNPRYGWYNGAWGGYWGSNWYSPLVWGGLGWGLGAYTSGWGSGYGYYNPYYASNVPSYAVYNYTQPVAVSTYVQDDPSQSAVINSTPTALDQGLALFKAGDYQKAMTYFDLAIKENPGDAVAHEVRALGLFALGDYQAAAAVLNSLLTSAPGMDWTTMSGLYGNVNDYSVQLRALESYCQAHPTDAAAYFVLAYHYLVTGYKEEAANALKVVVANQPKDVTARRMLDALVPPAAQPPAQSTSPLPTPSALPPLPDPNAPAANGPETDLVGTWRATAGGTTIDLTISEDSKFTWTATQSGQAPIKLTGDLVSSSDAVEFQNAEQGTMAGRVTSKGPDAWQFNLTGAPANDPGLSFARVM